MELQEFREQAEQAPATGKPASAVRSSGDDSQILKSLRVAMRKIQKSTGEMVSGLNDATRDQFAKVDADFNVYFDTIAEINDLLQKFLDPEQEATEEDSRRLQELLATEKRMLDAFQEKAQKDEDYNDKLLEAQRQSRFDLRKKSFQDEEMARASAIWGKTQSEVWDSMDRHLESFSTGFMAETGSNLIGAVFGQEMGYFAKVVSEKLPTLVRGAKNLPGQLKQAKETATTVRDRIKATRQLYRNKSVRTIMQSLIKGGVDLTGTEFADELTASQHRLEASSEQLPEVFEKSVSDLQETVANPSSTKDEVVEAATAVADASDLSTEVDRIRSEEKATETLTELVREARPSKDVADAVTEGTAIAGKTVEATGKASEYLSDIREASLEMMVLLDSLERKAAQILSGDIPARPEVLDRLKEITSVTGAVESTVAQVATKVEDSGDSSVQALNTGLGDLRSELANNSELQREIWEAEDDFRDKSLKWQGDLLKATKEIEGDGGGGGILGSLLSGLLGRKLGGKFLGPMMKRFGGSSVGRVASKALTSRVGKTALGVLGLGGLGSMLKGGGKEVTETAVKEGGEAVLKKTIAKEAGEAAVKKSAGKGLAKLGGKTLGKSALKKLPGIGLLAGLGFGAHRALKGDWGGALGEVASGAASFIPGAGTAVSLAIDAGLAARDVKNAMQEGEAPVAEEVSVTADEYQQFLTEGATEETAKINSPDMTLQEIAQGTKAGPAAKPTESKTITARPVIRSSNERKRTLEDIPVMVDDLGLILVASSRM